MTTCDGCGCRQPTPIYFGMGWEIFREFFYEGVDPSLAISGRFCNECSVKIRDPDQFDEFAVALGVTRRLRGKK